MGSQRTGVTARRKHAPGAWSALANLQPSPCTCREKSTRLPSTPASKLWTLAFSHPWERAVGTPSIFAPVRASRLSGTPATFVRQCLTWARLRIDLAICCLHPGPLTGQRWQGPASAIIIPASLPLRLLRSGSPTSLPGGAVVYSGDRGLRRRLFPARQNKIRGQSGATLSPKITIRQNGDRRLVPGRAHQE